MQRMTAFGERLDETFQKFSVFGKNKRQKLGEVNLNFLIKAISISVSLLYSMSYIPLILFAMPLKD